MSLSSTKLLPTTKTVVEYNNGNCTLCLEDETYNENGGSGFTIGNSGPIQGMDVTVTCDLVNEIAPLVRYISTCTAFRENYGSDLCCIRNLPEEATSAPTPATPSGGSYGARKELLGVIVTILAAVVFSG